MTKAPDLLRFYEDLDLPTFHELAQRLASINQNDIVGELSRQAAVYASYAGLSQYAKKRVSFLEIELNQCVTAAKIRARKECEAKGTKATVAVVDTFVSSDESCTEMTRELAILVEKEGLLKGLLNSLSQRKDCLIQLSSNQRNEMQMHS